jgi:hypothetical protein
LAKEIKKEILNTLKKMKIHSDDRAIPIRGVVSTEFVINIAYVKTCIGDTLQKEFVTILHSRSLLGLCIEIRNKFANMIVNNLIMELREVVYIERYMDKELALPGLCLRLLGHIDPNELYVSYDEEFNYVIESCFRKIDSLNVYKINAFDDMNDINKEDIIEKP